MQPPEYDEPSPRPQHGAPEAQPGLPPHVASVFESQQSLGNFGTTQLIKQQEEKEEKAEESASSSKRKAKLDDDVKRLLERSADAVAERTKLKTFIDATVRRAKRENQDKVNEFKTNELRVYVSDYAVRTFPQDFAAATRATPLASAISNPTFTSAEKDEISRFLRGRNLGGTVRPPPPIVVVEGKSSWSVKLHYDLTGEPHGGTHTPHAQFDKRQTTKDGKSYGGDHTRGMTFAETQELMKKPDQHPQWAVDWVTSVAKAES